MMFLHTLPCFPFFSPSLKPLSGHPNLVRKFISLASWASFPKQGQLLPDSSPKVPTEADGSLIEPFRIQPVVNKGKKIKHRNLKKFPEQNKIFFPSQAVSGNSTIVCQLKISKYMILI